METNVTPPTIVSLGLDPGLRNTGISAVERFYDGTYRTRGVRVIVTEPSKDKAFSRYRSSADDQRRIREHWNHITAAIQLMKPNVIGIENYVIFEPPDIVGLKAAATDVLALFGGAPDGLSLDVIHAAISQLPDKLQALHKAVEKNTRTGIGLGQAAKTIAVYGAALGAAYAAGVPVLVFEPHDRTRQIGGRKGASKEDVGRAVEARVHGLAEQMAEKVRQKTLKEHAWDATALAILAAEEYVRERLDLIGGVMPSHAPGASPS
jgi:Holliday junction resolvasome RuvABC endonuclease subunit